MEVIDETIPIRYRRIVDSDYSVLSTIREHYQKIGNRTWINPFDARKWVLTIEINGLKKEESYEENNSTSDIVFY